MYGSQTRRSYLLRLLLLTNQILNYDRRRQKIPCKTRSEPQGSYQRGVRKKKARQERVFKTYGKSGQKSSGNRAFLYAPSQILAKIFCAVYLHRNHVKQFKLLDYELRICKEGNR